METKQLTRRLCSEIQLFDLCDLETCRQKEGRFCTNPEALERFEAIKEEDDASERYLAEEELEEDEDDSDDYEAEDYEDDEM